jgi:RNA polymerase sigma-70 factor (ECF subfamily)
MPSPRPAVPNGPSSEELAWIAAAQRNPEAFAPLYDRYYASVFGFVARRVADDDLAADLTADAFLKALTALPRYRPQGAPFGAWLLRIALNEVNQHYRRQKTQRVVRLPDTAPPPPDRSETPPAYSQPHWYVALAQALQTLQPAELQLVELRFFEQRSYAEIAVILDINETNARVRALRTLKRLRATLQGLYPYGLPNGAFADDSSPTDSTSAL